MFRNILVPFDGSEPANRALSVALALGEGPEPVSITVLQAAGLTDFDRSSYAVAARMAGLMPIDDSQIDAMQDNYISIREACLRKQIGDCLEAVPENITITIAVEQGSPRDVICRHAKDNGIDCIIMGRRGDHGIRATLGSVSATVLRDTDLPVLVVK